MNATRCLSYAGQQMCDDQLHLGGDNTHIVWDMVTRHHLARLVDNDTVQSGRAWSVRHMSA